MIGTAGWSIPAPHANAFPTKGSHLERYSRRFAAVEINSSFYRPHRPSTYERWATTVPAGFQFAVKVPRTITHDRRLAHAEEPLARFLTEVQALGSKLGPLLLQLPPSFAFKADLVAGFLEHLRDGFDGVVACEPRHSTWFTDEPDRLLAEYRVGRVAADPAVVPRAAEPGGCPTLRYYRLHGSPRMYYSAYTPERLAALVQRLSQGSGTAWCIFDNTAEGAAAHDAMEVTKALSGAAT